MSFFMHPPNKMISLVLKNAIDEPDLIEGTLLLFGNSLKLLLFMS